MVDRFEARARFAATQDVVWHVLWSPATAQQVFPEVVRLSTLLPGTGPGVGEIHVQVGHESKPTLEALIVREMRPPEYVRYETLSTESSTEEITVVAGPAATEVRWTVTITWPVDTRVELIEDHARNDRAFMETYLRGSGRIIGAPIDLDGVWRTT